MDYKDALGFDTNDKIGEKTFREWTENDSGTNSLHENIDDFESNFYNIPNDNTVVMGDRMHIRQRAQDVKGRIAIYYQRFTSRIEHMHEELKDDVRLYLGQSCHILDEDCIWINFDIDSKLDQDWKDQIINAINIIVKAAPGIQFSMGKEIHNSDLAIYFKDNELLETFAQENFLNNHK